MFYIVGLFFKASQAGLKSLNIGSESQAISVGAYQFECVPIEPIANTLEKKEWPFSQR